LISLESKTKFQSVTFPEVSFTIRRYSEGLRHKISLAVATLAREHNELSHEIEPLRIEYRTLYEAAADDAKPSAPVELLALLERRQQIVAELDHIWIRIGFVKAEGIEVDSSPLTAESLIETMPDLTFFNEVRDAIKREYGMTETERKNSLPPGTLEDQAAGKTSTSTADTANDKGSTSPEIAANTSPTT
jgi:hypothetical protein